jgi:hypothetical protein
LELRTCMFNNIYSRARRKDEGAAVEAIREILRQARDYEGADLARKRVSDWVVNVLVAEVITLYGSDEERVWIG